MLVANPVIGMPNLLYGDFPLLMRQWNQLASRVLLRSPTFIRVDVGIITAQNSVVRPVQCLQAEHVGSGSIEGKEHVDAGPEMLFEFRDGRTRVIVVAISPHVSPVGAHNRLKNLRMHTGIVIAGKTTLGFGQNLLHTGTM